MTGFPITIYHNPDCGTSRNTLAMIRAVGYEPEVIEYRAAGWTRPLLDRLLAAMAAHPILVNRPILETPRGVKLCRPSEVVFSLLDRRPASFTKEDGENVRFD